MRTQCVALWVVKQPIFSFFIFFIFPYGLLQQVFRLVDNAPVLRATSTALRAWATRIKEHNPRHRFPLTKDSIVLSDHRSSNPISYFTFNAIVSNELLSRSVRAAHHHDIIDSWFSAVLNLLTVRVPYHLYTFRTFSRTTQLGELCFCSPKNVYIIVCMRGAFY